MQEDNLVTQTNAQSMADVPAETYAHLQAPGPARPLLPIIQPVVEDLGYELLRAYDR